MLTLTACGSESLPEVEMTVAGHSLTVEIADSQEERSTGLMHRDNLEDDRGMLFVFDKEQLASFWMKDTLIPLSIAFISADGTIRQIEDMEPQSLASVKSHRSILYALEVNRGWFDERNINPGDRVVLPIGYQ